MEFPACKQINKQSNGEKTMKQIEVRGDRVHNLKNIDVNVPLNKIAPKLINTAINIHGAGVCLTPGLLTLQFCLNDHRESPPVTMWLL